MQVIGAFMLVLVIVATIAGLYLSISGRAAAAGRRIQELEMQATTLNLEINNLRTRLAQVSSSHALNERISDLNMRILDPIPPFTWKCPVTALTFAKAVEISQRQ